jgi:ADP-ribose pyrophosphatase YjhB (NUDIX family)
MTAQNETFLQAFGRESREETGLDVPLSSAALLDVEIRRFVNVDTGERQHIIVGTVVGRPLGNLVAGLELELTPEAAAEGLRKIGAYALDGLPELIFNDELKVRDAVDHCAMAA